MVSILPSISDEVFTFIRAVMPFRDGTDIDEFRKELQMIGQKFNIESRDLSGGPTIAQLRKRLEKIIASAQENVRALEIAYTSTEEFISVPEALLPVTRGLNELERAASHVIDGMPPSKPGKDLNYAFRNLIHAIANVFMQFSDEPLSTDDTDKRRLPVFHQVAVACCEAFGVEIGKAFDTKLHKTVIELRKSGRIPRN